MPTFDHTLTRQVLSAAHFICETSLFVDQAAVTVVGLLPFWQVWKDCLTRASASYGSNYMKQILGILEANGARDAPCKHTACQRVQMHVLAQKHMCANTLTHTRLASLQFLLRMYRYNFLWCDSILASCPHLPCLSLILLNMYIQDLCPD